MPRKTAEGPYRGPAPLLAIRGEPISHRRMRALSLAEYHRLIGEYIGPVDADTVAPTELVFLYVSKPGRTVADLADDEDPENMLSEEVLEHCYALGVAAGIPEVFAYRPGQRGYVAPGDAQ